MSIVVGVRRVKKCIGSHLLTYGTGGTWQRDMAYIVAQDGISLHPITLYDLQGLVS